MAQGPFEMSVQMGEVLTWRIQDTGDGWTGVQRVHAVTGVVEEGYVPTSFCAFLYHPIAAGSASDTLAAPPPPPPPDDEAAQQQSDAEYQDETTIEHYGQQQEQQSHKQLQSSSSSSFSVGPRARAALDTVFVPTPEASKASSVGAEYFVDNVNMVSCTELRLYLSENL